VLRRFKNVLLQLHTTKERSGQVRELIARSRETGQMEPVRREVGDAPRNVRTVEHEEPVLNVFAEDDTRSIRTVSREMGLSKSSV
jgi:predicted ATP-grasp superfamily ATP-dependent carboligase